MKYTKPKGYTDDLFGVTPAWRMAEAEPIYMEMLAEGYPNPFMDEDSVAPGNVLAGETVSPPAAGPPSVTVAVGPEWMTE